jgi:hypothetical protein
MEVITKYFIASCYKMDFINLKNVRSDVEVSCMFIKIFNLTFNFSLNFYLKMFWLKTIDLFEKFILFS